MVNINPNWMIGLFLHILKSKAFNILVGFLFGFIISIFALQTVKTQKQEYKATSKLFETHILNVNKTLLDIGNLISFQDNNEKINLYNNEHVKLVKTGLLIINDNHRKLSPSIWDSEELKKDLDKKFKTFHKAQFIYLRRIDRFIATGDIDIVKETKSKIFSELNFIASELIEYKETLLQLNPVFKANGQAITLKNTVFTALTGLFAILTLFAFGKVLFNASSEFIEEKKRKGFRVLIVDDDSDVLETIIDNCSESVNCQFIAAYNGVEALKRLGEKSYDLVISDISMPNMGGIELAKKITKAGNVPIVLMTCNSTVKLSQEVFGQNRVFYIYDKFEVLNNIEKIITNTLSEGGSGQPHRKVS
jgi:CheY-like chemotaxis protein